MKADNPNYPMPLGSQDGIYRLIINEEGMLVLPGIFFKDLGIYTYRINQVPGENQAIDYDERVYNLVIYVTNSQSGQGLDTMVILYLLGEPTKQEEIVLDNEYSKAPTKVPQTGDDTIVWPYVALFLSGAGMLIMTGFTVNKKKPDND